MNNAELAEIFTEARRLIVEGGWIQDEFAQNNDGEGVRWNSPNATCFCAVAAIFRAAPRLRGVSIGTASEFLGRTFGTDFMPVDAWNDDPVRTKEDVIQFFDALITHLQSVETGPR